MWEPYCISRDNTVSARVLLYQLECYCISRDNNSQGVTVAAGTNLSHQDKPGVKGIIGMHRFNICLVVVLLWCENTITLASVWSAGGKQTRWRPL